MDRLFVDALCKSKEKEILGEDKLLRLADSKSPEDGLRFLSENGFGGETATEGAHDFEKLIAYEEKKLFDFLKEYADKRLVLYALSEVDVHNVESAVRAKYLKIKPYYISGGSFSAEELDNIDSLRLPEVLKRAVESASELFENGEATGYKISNIFVKALYELKLGYSRVSKNLHEAVVWEIDAKNIMTAIRSGNSELAKDGYISGGKLNAELDSLFKSEKDIKEAFKETGFSDFVSLCKSEKPMVNAERVFGGHTLSKFKEKRYETVDGIDPTVLYYLCKENELKNVRSVMVGLNVGLDKAEIIRRVRENYAG